MEKKTVLKNIGLFFIFCLMVSGYVLTMELSSLDEVWVYNFARCMVNGLLPYKDFSIIITPLFPMISSIFLRIFGDQMVSLRIFGIIQISAILFMNFKILTSLKINKWGAFASTLLLYFVYNDIFWFDYNWLALLITLVVLYIEIKSLGKDVNYKKEILLGILVRTCDTYKANNWSSFSICICFT